MTLVYDHRKWADKENFRVKNFGLPPKLLHFSKSWYYILYLKLSITRKIITFIIFYLEKITFDIKQNFFKILSTTWDSFTLIAMN